ncbi:MAG: hypothetical protein ACP5M8_08105, partial [Caldisphaera sp.]
IDDLNHFLLENDNSKKLSWLNNALYHSYQLKLYQESNNKKYFDKSQLCFIKLNDNLGEIIDAIKKFVNNESVEGDIKGIIDYFTNFMEKKKKREYVLR